MLASVACFQGVGCAVLVSVITIFCVGSGKKRGLWEPPEQTEQVPGAETLATGLPRLWSQGTKASFQG